MTIVALFLMGFFPYCLVLEGVLMFVGVIEVPLTTYNFPFVVAIPVVACMLAGVGLVYLLAKGDRVRFRTYAMLLNILQIPAHLFNLFFCIAFALTLFGIIFAPAFIGVSVLAFIFNWLLRQEGTGR